MFFFHEKVVFLGEFGCFWWILICWVAHILKKCAYLGCFELSVFCAEFQQKRGGECEIFAKKVC